MTIAALQRDPTISDPVRADLQTIQRNIELEALLIDDLLDLTRIIHGKLELHSDAVDVHALIEHAIAMSVADADGKRLRLTRHLNATEHHCWADAARLQQVFWNLIKNAVKFTPAGGEVHVTTRNEGDHRVVIEVADTGVGITADVLPRIFDAFEQGGRSVTGKYGGLGLGLAISKSIIDLHDGSISAESAGRGRGSKFTVGLQAIATSLLDTPTYAVDRPSAARGMQRILLVEDHEDTARVFRRMLEHAGYAVHFARCIADAREVAAREEFDLVISDVGLPDGTGLDLMRELRQSKRLTGIALSGFGTDEDIAASREAGFAEHITKPVDWDRLRAVIERVAHASRADELSPA
jgi:CheY-like chemotaxis protein/two-component sensor histidine kinase